MSDSIPNISDLVAKDYISEQYSENSPNILFISDYIVDGLNRGCLIVWQEYENSTHYHLYRKDLFEPHLEEDGEFSYKRILFATKKQLKNMTKYFIPYIKNTLGIKLSDENKIFAIVDKSPKIDKIYSYKLRASYLIDGYYNIDYFNLLKTKEKIISFPVTTHTLKSLSIHYFGEEIYSWIVPLLNYSNKSGEDIHGLIPYFNYNINQDDAMLKNFGNNPVQEVYLPAHKEDIMSIYFSSVGIFGIRKTIEAILFILHLGLDDPLLTSCIDSIDEENMVFVEESFKELFVQRVDTTFTFSSDLVLGENVSLTQLDKISLFMSYLLKVYIAFIGPPDEFGESMDEEV